MVADDSNTLASISSVEKSNLLRTDAMVVAVLGATIDPRMGDETGPREGFLRAGDCRYVFIGDLERGGGIRVLWRALSTAVGSGTVPDRSSAGVCKSRLQKTYSRPYPYPPHLISLHSRFCAHHLLSSCWRASQGKRKGGP